MPKVQVNLYELDLDTLAMVEELTQAKTLTIKQMRSLVAGFLVDEEGNSLSPEASMEAAGKLRLREVREVMAQIGAAFGDVQAAAVPKETSSPS